MLSLRALSSLVLLLLSPLTLVAQSEPTQASGDTARPAEVRVDPRSPRSAVTEYLTLSRRGDYAAAGRFFGDVTEERGAELARRLKIVLDRHLWFDLELLSPLAEGDLNDGLPRDREQIGLVPGPDGGEEPVQLRRVAAEGGPTWIFSTATTERVDVWFDALSDHWLREMVPMSLQRIGPLGVELWQWTLLFLLIPLAVLLSYVAASVTAFVLRRASARTDTDLDDAIVANTRGPIRAIWTSVLFRALVVAIGLPLGVERGVLIAAGAFTVVFVTWLLIRVVSVLESRLPTSPWATDRPELKAIIPLIGRIVRVFLFALGIIGIVAQFGYSVATLVAGLGIGGIAVALAAQKTLEHVFGSVALGLDQPIRVGDWIRAGEVTGSVESIGLRSTRIRTLDRSVITVPNGQLSEQTTENFGVRDRFVLRTTVGLEYGTKAAQLKAVRDDLEATLRAHPLIWPDVVVVRFGNFGAFSLDIEVIAWLLTPDIHAFREEREKLFFEFMGIVEKHGCSFAFPTQTLHLINATKPPA